MHKIEQYFQTKAISNSLLNAVQNPRWLKIKTDNPDVEDDEKAHFRIGSALDCLLTSPEDWEDSFLIIDAKRPSGLMGKFIDNLPSGLDPLLSDTYEYKEAYDKSGYKTKVENIISKLWNNPEFVDYYLSTRNVDKTKTILSKDEYEQVLKAKELILANEFTEYYFKNSEDTDSILESMSQVPIYFHPDTDPIDDTSINEDCKALLDRILINHEAKTIQPCDLKTTGKSVYDFRKAYIDYGYYRQAAFYDWALRQAESPVKELIANGYHILPFKFIVVETKLTSNNAAIIYSVSENDLYVGKYGGTINGRKYKGIMELIAAYKFHKENDYWELPKDIFDNKGVIELNVFNNE